MTTVSGFNIIACPGCGTRFRLPIYGSVFISDTEQWSDGRTRSRLFKPSPNACVCPCGAPFLLHECERVARMKWIRPVEVPSPQRSLWAALRGESGPRCQYIPGRYDTEIFSGEPWPEYPEPPDWAPRPTVEAFTAAAAGLPAGTPFGLEVALRRELWRLLNDAARPSKDSSDDARDPASSPAWLPNLERLHGLLAQDATADRTEIGETLRQLGRFDEAIKVFNEVGGDRAPLASFLFELADHRVALTALIPDRVFEAMQPGSHDHR